MNDTEFSEKRKRVVTKERAKLAAQRLINSHFNNPGQQARMSIPPDVDDDDIVICDFIDQSDDAVQAAVDAALQQAANAIRKENDLFASEHGQIDPESGCWEATKVQEQHCVSLDEAEEIVRALISNRPCTTEQVLTNSNHAD